MLAKENKIKTLSRQRKFIETQLNDIAENREDGNTSYTYVGSIYPEVIKHFENEGYDVTLVKSDLLSALAKGMPVYLFTVGDIKLSEEELKQAEEYNNATDDEDEKSDEDDISELMNEIFGGPISRLF